MMSEGGVELRGDYYVLSPVYRSQLCTLVGPYILGGNRFGCVILASQSSMTISRTLLEWVAYLLFNRIR